MATGESFGEKRLRWMQSFDTATRAKIARSARNQITAKMAKATEKHGFAFKPEVLEKRSMLRLFRIHLQPSRSGFQTFINLSVSSAFSHWRSRATVYRLGRFYDSPPAKDAEPGALTYLDVYEGSRHLDYACYVLTERALPFMARRDNRPHLIAEWIKDQPALPAFASSAQAP